MENNMYDAVRKVKTPRRDKRLWIAAAAAALIFAVAVAPMVWSAHYQRQYRLFSTDLADSSLYAQRHGCLVLERGGETFPLKAGSGYDSFLARVVTTGSGRTGRAPDQPPAATISYGNGATLELWSVHLEGYVSTDREEGLFLRYTYPDGKTYGYDSERLDLESTLRLLEHSITE